MTRKGKKSNKGLIGIVLVLLIAIGIGVIVVPKLSKGKSQDNNTNQQSSESKKQEPIKKLNIVNPDSTSRPYAVMINNIITARPLQSGLQDAYMVYEIIVEGGITRYMALFMDSSAERIGSIRSARHYFLDYALENDAIYVHHGQSPQAQSDFSKLGVDRIVVDNSNTGWRDKTLNVASEHTLFTSIEKLNNGIGSKRTTRNKNLLLNYSIDELDLSTYEGAKKADTVSIKYSNSNTTGYTYDSEKGYYLRDTNGTAQKDYVTKEQLHVKNIITYQVKNYTLNDGENKGRQDIENVGNGTGYFISNGYAVPIKWSKKSRSEQTKYTLNDGTELKVNDGNTFIQIQPTGMDLKIS